MGHTQAIFYIKYTNTTRGFFKYKEIRRGSFLRLKWRVNGMKNRTKYWTLEEIGHFLTDEFISENGWKAIFYSIHSQISLLSQSYAICKNRTFLEFVKIRLFWTLEINVSILLCNACVAYEKKYWWWLMGHLIIVTTGPERDLELDNNLQCHGH